jgi:collagen type VII alpha
MADFPDFEELPGVVEDVDDVEGEFEDLPAIVVISDIGEPGPAGMAGPPGADGADGPMGPMGPKGDPGDPGAPGEPGPAGGPMGPAGPVGPEGPVGPIGLTGPVGPIGPKGDKGDQGVQGPTGPAGQDAPGAIDTTPFVTKDALGRVALGGISPGFTGENAPGLSVGVDYTNPAANRINNVSSYGRLNHTSQPAGGLYANGLQAGIEDLATATSVITEANGVQASTYHRGSGAAALLRGAWLFAVNAATAGPITSALFGALNQIINQSPSTAPAVPLGIGSSATAENSGSGTLTEARGVSGQILSTLGRIVRAFTFKVRAPSGGGTVDELHGVYIEDHSQKATTSGVHANLTSKGATSENVFEGNVRVGGDLEQTAPGGALVMRQPNGTTRRVTLDNTGALAGVVAPAGPAGAAGPAGPQGPIGPAGADGAAGPIGPAGPVGPVGPAGPRGFSGDQGEPGDTPSFFIEPTEVIDADQPPAVVLGGGGSNPTLTFRLPRNVSGAFVDEVEHGGWDQPASAGVQLDPTTGQLGFSFSIPAGEPGAPGAPGAAGAAGAQGPIGPAGPKGDTGAAGAAGAQGIQGPAGAAGAQGIQGPIGPTGPKGDTGDVGPAGAAGAQGIQGIQGVQGATGPSGVVVATAPVTYDAPSKTVALDVAALTTTLDATFATDAALTAGLAGKVGTGDARLSDARTPTAHAGTHATGGSDPITPAAIGAAASSHTHPASAISDSTATGRSVLTAADATAGRTALGAASSTDTRFTDARTPTAHKTTHATGGTDALTPADIGAAAAAHTQAASTISDSTTVGRAVLTAVDAAAGRTALGALSSADASVTNARTPTVHATSHATGGSDPITPAAIGAAPTAHTQAASTISDSTTVGRAVLTAADAAAGRTAIGALSATDPSVTNSRTPTAHAASHATGGGDAITPAAIGAVATTDASVTNARTPTAHKATHATGGTDALAPADIGAAALASPAFTGTPTAPTAAAGTNSTQLATTAYADAISAAILARQVGAALAADATAIASTTFVTAAGLSVSLPANTVWVVEWDADVTVATATETFGANVTAPAGATGNYDAISKLATASAGPHGNVLGTGTATTVFGNNGSATALQPVRVRATVRMGATAGLVNLQFAGSTTGAITPKINSSVLAARLS